MQTEDQKKARETIVKGYTDRIIAAFEDMSSLAKLPGSVDLALRYLRVTCSLTLSETFIGMSLRLNTEKTSRMAIIDPVKT
jgi:hypothetical protein